MTIKRLTDDSPMPYGKYKGVKMANVPNNYLRYLLESGRFTGKDGILVKDYINNNIEIICPDRTPQ